MSRYNHLKPVPDFTPEKQRTHLEWCESLRVRQGVARIAHAHMICAYLDKDWAWIEQYFINAGFELPSGMTAQEYFETQQPVFDALLMGEIPSDADLEKSKQLGS